MKKLLAMLLSLIMALSLAVPAFADSPDTPPAAGDLGIIGGADGPTVIVTGTPDDGSYADVLKAAMGGVPGQVGVMVNGVYVKFPDAAPEITKDRTMVPVRALVETLGGKIDYQDGIVQFIIDGYVYEFAIGSTTVSVTPVEDGGENRPDIIMDCAPYIKDSRTYVPIRFISEALGYEVGWDNDFQTAILSNRDLEELAAEIDKDFTIMNKVQAAGALSLKEGESGQTSLKGNMVLTMASLEGNKTYKADFDASTLMNSEAVNGDFSLKLSDNISDLLVELLISSNSPDSDIAEVRKSVEQVLGALEKFEFIMNKDGKMWVHSDGLDSMAGQKNAWLGTSIDLGGDLDLSALLAGTGASTVGTAVAAMADKNSVMSWFTMMQTVSILELYSDDKFTTSGGTSTLTLGLDELMGIYEDIGLSAEEIEQAKGVFKVYEISMKVDSKGEASVTCKVETSAESGLPSIKMMMDATQSNGTGAVTMEINVAEMGKLELTLTTTQKTTTDKPITEPPEGAVIVDMDAPAVLPE